MNEKTKDLREVSSFVFCVIKGIEKAKEDKEINEKDIPLLLPALVKLPEAIDGVENVTNLDWLGDEEARESYLEFVEKEFDLVDDDKEAKIERIATHVATIAEGFYGLSQELL